MSRTLIVIGAVFIIAGLLWPVIKTIGLGSLPGDITIRRDNFTFFFPVTTMIIVSVALTVILNLFR